MSDDDDIWNDDDTEQQQDSFELEAIDDNAPLTDKEKLFIMYYTESLNKTLAYRKAYPEELKNLNTVSSITNRAIRLLEKPKIKKIIHDKIQKSLDQEIAKSPNVLLKQIERYLELDPADFYRDDGTVIPLSELDEEKRLLISNINKQISAKTGGVVLTYELPSKIKLLDKLSDLVKFVAQVRAVAGETQDTSSDAAKKRDAIFNGVDDDDIKDVSEKIKKRRKVGRPKSKVHLDKLPDDLRKAVEDAVNFEVIDNDALDDDDLD